MIQPDEREASVFKLGTMSLGLVALGWAFYKTHSLLVLALCVLALGSSLSWVLVTKHNKTQ